MVAEGARRVAFCLRGGLNRRAISPGADEAPRFHQDIQAGSRWNKTHHILQQQNIYCFQDEERCPESF
jgi:hypothetical protein